MDVEDAFTEEAISRFGTNVEDETETELKDIITRIYTTNELDPPNADDLNVAVLCFVAGRTYQSDQSGEVTIPIPMTPNEVHEYIAYLAQRGAP
jgi:hypothetical protein